MRFLLALFLLPGSILAQTEVSVQHGLVTTVRVSNSEMPLMCGGFVQNLGILPENGMIHLKPKTLPFGQNEMFGEVWVVSVGDREFEVERSKLPMPLKALRGVTARHILRGTCYLRESSFYSPRDVVFVTADLSTAQVLARSLRGG